MMDSTVNPPQSSSDLPSLRSTLQEAFISARDRTFSTNAPSPSEENGAGEALPSTFPTSSTLWESIVLACKGDISTDVPNPSEENDIHNLTVAATAENATLSDRLSASQHARYSLKRKISNLHTRLTDTIVTYNAEAARLQREFTNLDTRLHDAIAAKDVEIANLDARLHDIVAAKDAQIADLETHLRNTAAAKDAEIALLQRRSTNLETRLVDTVAARDAENVRLQEELRALNRDHQAYVMRDVVRRAGVPDERDWTQAVQVNQRLTTELAQTIQDRDMALAKCGELIGNLQRCARLNIGLEGELQVAKGVKMEDDDNLMRAKGAFKDTLRKCYQFRKDAEIAEGEMALLREKVGEEEAARISKRAKVLAAADGGDPAEDELQTLRFEPTQEESEEYRAIFAEKKKGAGPVFVAQVALSDELQLSGLADARTI